MHLLGFLLFGLIVGLIARAITPGPQRMGVLSTALLGIGGSLLGGILGDLIIGGPWNRPVAAGWVGSIVGSLLLLGLVRPRGPMFRS